MDIDLFDAFETDSAPAQRRKSRNSTEEGGGSSRRAERLANESEVAKRKAIETASESDGAGAGKRVKATTVVDISPIASATSATSSSSSFNASVSASVEANQPAAPVAPPVERVPAKVYPFQLDTFQREAVNYIDNDESVLVAAHTSAGKTAVAEYAIAKSLKNGQRVIYTSPIKALSNQKYRDLQEEFHDVGLMTGDMTLNPTATCLIMTTEILRSMLYRGSEVMREVAWVIYDEVHYMRDKERGVVWEESIILLPHKVRFVFLSATIPNAKEFVNWVSKIHHQPCHVVYTEYRPVPLQHFVYPNGADGLYLVVDDKGKFREDNFQKAMVSLQGPSELEENTAKKRPKKTANAAAELFKIVKLVMEREIDPVIVFSFSKKNCETYALQMAKLDFNNDEEKALVEHVFTSAIAALTEEDQSLPQVVTILPLLKRGIGIHHGGLLPILKEVIEILFQEGLIKCLFATETFSIGINMPARTVVFTSTRKFDGQDFRWVTSGEYIQMSGRAGRRGKDDRGIVIQMLEEKMDPQVCKDMIYGQSDPLFSSYHVSYNMVLNMLRVEDADPENLLRSSFHQYQQECEAPALENKAIELQREASFIRLVDETEEGMDAEKAAALEEKVSDYHTLLQSLKMVQQSIRDIVMNADFCRPYFNSGRLFHVRDSTGCDWGWGILVDSRKFDPTMIKPNLSIGFSTSGTSSAAAVATDSTEVATATASANTHILNILLQVRKEPVQVASTKSAAANGSAQELTILPIASDMSLDEENKLAMTNAILPEVIQVSLNAISSISQVKLDIPIRDLVKENIRKNLFKSLREIRRRFSNSKSGDGSTIPVLDPIKDMGIADNNELKVLIAREIELKKRIESSLIHSHPKRKSFLEKYRMKCDLLEAARAQRQAAKESQTLTMKDELRKRKRILKRLGYTSATGVLTPKGRFSCELTTGDELVLTDMVFEGCFSGLSIEQTVAILSCFVHKEGQHEEGSVKVRADMQDILRKLQTIARTVAKVSSECLLALDEEEYVKSFNPGLIDVTYAWVSGAKFIDICRLTDVFEGSIIRAIRRLEELLRQLASAAMSIGNVDLKTLFETGADKIRRGVVFAASLYL